jgi:6-phosphogluconate dehydrogenase
MPISPVSRWGARLPANLLQGQRDYFGAHTYERVDQPRGKFFHIDWPENPRPQLSM